MRAADFTSLIFDCSSEVFEAMYFTDLVEARFGVGELQSALKKGAYVFGLDFSGDVVGRFGVSLGRETALALASNFLGQDAGEVADQDVGEVVGELANILCGSVLSGLKSVRRFVLSHPVPVPLYSRESREDVLISTLETDNGSLAIWIVVEGKAC